MIAQTRINFVVLANTTRNGVTTSLRSLTPFLIFLTFPTPPIPTQLLGILGIQQ